jgi:gamma-glutamyltranspeptidase/glutathione hydrolase
MRGVSAEAGRAMVIGTSGRPAIVAAVRALKDGASAVDAALIATLLQPVLAAGSWNSYAGILAMVCYDARTRSVHSLNAGYNTLRREKHPESIPMLGRPSGRSALVPGFMAGVQAAHDRFGTLPFAKLFEPAIDHAERGFRTPSWLGRLFRSQRHVLTRLPEGRRIFTHRRGGLHRTGDLFRQPELAATLRKVGRHGAGYIYRGEWGRRFVSAVSREGGHITREDLRRYRPLWAEPARTFYHGYDVCGPGLPGLGGVHTIEALNLLDCADLFPGDHYSKSARALYWLMQITHAAYLRAGVPLRTRMSKAGARRLWSRMQKRRGLRAPLGVRRRLSHTDGIVAIDEQGNIASISHSINSVAWGTTGIFVDGVSIPDSACFQQREIRRVGPGARLPEQMNPIIVLKDGRPILASTCTGYSLHETMVQYLVDVLDFGLGLGSALRMPHFLLPVWSTKRFRSARRRKTKARPVLRQVLKRGTFSADVVRAVRAMGQGIQIVRQSPPGYWGAVQFDPAGHKLWGAVTTEPAGAESAAAGY